MVRRTRSHGRISISIPPAEDELAVGRSGRDGSWRRQPQQRHRPDRYHCGGGNPPSRVLFLVPRLSHAARSLSRADLRDDDCRLARRHDRFRRPSVGRTISRYIIVFLVWWLIVPLSFIWRRILLHDRWTKTRVVKVERVVARASDAPRCNGQAHRRLSGNDVPDRCSRTYLSICSRPTFSLTCSTACVVGSTSDFTLTISNV